MHDLDERCLARPILDCPSRADDRAHLHFVDLRELQAQAAPARAEHRVRLLQLPDAAAHRLVRRLLDGRQELVQRRVEQTDGDRQPRHRLEDRFEVPLLHREQPVERLAASVLAVGEDHLAHDREPVLGHEHVLGPAEADPLRPELARFRCVLRRVGVRAHRQAPVLVAPAEHGLEVVVHLRGNEPDLAHDHRPGAAVDREHLAFGQCLTSEHDRARIEIDRERLAAGDTRLAHPARHDGRVRRHPAVRRQDAGRLDQAVDVVGRRLPADEDHALAPLAPLLGRVGVEDDLPAGRARRGIQALRGHLPLRGRVEHRMQQLVELGRIDALDRLLT